MRLLPVIIQDEFNRRTKRRINSRPDALYVCSPKTANSTPLPVHAQNRKLTLPSWVPREFILALTSERPRRWNRKISYRNGPTFSKIIITFREYLLFIFRRWKNDDNEPLSISTSVISVTLLSAYLFIYLCLSWSPGWKLPQHANGEFSQPSRVWEVHNKLWSGNTVKMVKLRRM